MQEIIEFPAVILDVKKQKIVARFHHYIKPEVHPELTKFCTELTGIQQETVDAGIPITKALRLLHEFLLENGVLGTNYAFLSCGDFDSKALKREAEYKGFFVPSYLKRWINIKRVFPLHLFLPSEKDKAHKYEVNNVYRHKHAVIDGMPHMLKTVGLELEGRHHSGIDDTINIARIVIECLKVGFKFHEGHVAALEYETGDRSQKAEKWPFHWNQGVKEALEKSEDLQALEQSKALEVVLMMSECM